MVRIVSRPILGGFLLAFLLSGCDSPPPDDRIEKLSRESLSRQAEQNQQMGRQSEAVARATEKLVEADAQARKQAQELHREIQAERASLDRQHEELEDERREIASERYWDPVIANVVSGAAVLIATVLPLLLCFHLLKSLYGRTSRDGLDELLITELADPHSSLLRLPDNSNAGIEQGKFEQSTLPVRLPAPSDPESPAASTPARIETKPLLVIVEGKFDVEFLQRIARILHAEDSTLPALDELEAERRLVFLPSGGGAAAESFERLAALGHPQFYLLDRESEAVAVEREQLAASLNSKPHCRAVITQKRAIENYLHPDAIHEATGLRVSFGDDDDVPQLVARAKLAESNGPDWDSQSRRSRRRLRDKTKESLNTDAVDRMTPERLAERDPQGEVQSWLFSIAEMATT